MSTLVTQGEGWLPTSVADRHVVDWFSQQCVGGGVLKEALVRSLIEARRDWQGNFAEGVCGAMRAR